MNKDKYLITTAIDYTNNVIHIGHAYQKLLADCIARFYRSKLGYEKVYFLTGTDEYGTTSEKAARELGIDPKTHVNDISNQDREQLNSLNISYNRFIRTTDEDHKKTAQNFYQKVYDNGDIYKEIYKGLYCEGCESYKTLSELNEQNQCLLHTTRIIQTLDEENYFFKWSKYSKFLEDLITNNKNFVLPEGKKKEMLSFIERGIEDIPISRPKYKVSWGIDVPNDKEHVIYVWFDALINYFTAANPLKFWNEDTKIIHILGKDNAKWHVLLWPAMLKSAGYKLPDTEYVHGFINLEGQKISKSKGNVILPTALTQKYGVDAVRYYFLKFGPITEDVDVSLNQLEQAYNGELANGLGNTVARVAKLAENSKLTFEMEKNKIFPENNFDPLFEDFRVDLALRQIWDKYIFDIDKHVNKNKPWEIKDKKKLKEILGYEISKIRELAFLLEPFMPETALKIQKQFGKEQIKSNTQLFPRIV